MSRNVSSNFRSGVYAQNTEEVYLLLITIDHADLADPIRVTQDPMEELSGGAKGVISRGDEFVALPFEVTLPNQDANQSPSARLKIDNITREIVTAARSITSPADVMLEVVLASDPDTVEAVMTGFKLREVTYDAFTVEGELTIELFELEPFPAGRMTPSRFSGLF